MASTGRLPWTELAFRIEGLAGAVSMQWSLAPGTQFQTTSASASREQGVAVLRIGEHTVVTLCGKINDESATEMAATFTVRAKEKFVLALLATNGEPLLVPTLEAIDARLDATKDNWRRWTALVNAPERWSEEVTRSALVLKSLLAEYTGAIAAAATTSLPEKIGGPKNWDYRFSWVRDSSFAIDALINLGLAEEVHNGVAWLLRAIRRNGPKLHVFYTLTGEKPGAEVTLDASGYRNSQPVRSGNGAARQRQLGNYGDVFDTVYQYVKEGNLLDLQTQDCLGELARRCAKEWRKPDSGIWELQETQQYTISKIGCWVALDRAVKIHEMGQLRDADVERWGEERDAIREFIDQNCWSEKKRSYTFYAGTDQLDASVLLCARTHFDVGERLVGTIDAVSRELKDGPLVYRYTGARDSEGAFIACTFWLVEALAASGQLGPATQLMEEAVGLTNDVGLLAEQMDPANRAFLGNAPQALSHLALINAAFAIHEQATR
jgi:GH15 family glucan-1,4-alpha-glucosidase